jgi:DNA-binding response OmpR family regulator
MARILVVDDEPPVAVLLRDALTLAGHEVYTAPDGVQAMRILKESSFALLITDVVMPEMDGLELISELKKLDQPPEVIAISGAPGQWKVLNTAQTLGVVRVLTKPFTLAELLQAVRASLSRQGMP